MLKQAGIPSLSLLKLGQSFHALSRSSSQIRVQGLTFTPASSLHSHTHTTPRENSDKKSIFGAGTEISQNAQSQNRRLFKGLGHHPMIFVPSRTFAARKGTRTRKEKKKVKKEEVQKKFIFKSIRKQMEMPYIKQRPLDDSHLDVAVDDVYFTKRFQAKAYPFAEAIQNYREVYHPTMYNGPNMPISLRVNIDLTYPKRPNKFQEGWRSVIEMTAPFVLAGMARPSVIAFCQEDSDVIAEVLKAGADLAGSKEIIRSIQEGEINANDYEYIVAHPSIVPDLTAIRGLIKKKFPTVKTKTISVDLIPEIKRLKGGVKIRLEKNDREPDFGFFDLCIGTLEMSDEELEGNFASVLEDTVPRRVPGKTPEEFIVSCVLKILHEGRQREHFKVDISSYLEDLGKTKKGQRSSAEAEEAEIQELLATEAKAEAAQ